MSTSKEQELAAIHGFLAAFAQHDRDRIGAVSPRTSGGPSPATTLCPGSSTAPRRVLAFFDGLAAASMTAETWLLEASHDLVVDIHRGWFSAGGQRDADWA